MKLGYKPVFVGGAPRSGTTLVASMLASSAKIVAAPELHFIPKMILIENEEDDPGIRKIKFILALCSDPKFIDLGIVENFKQISDIAGERDCIQIADKVIKLFNQKYYQKNFSHWVEHSPDNHYNFNQLDSLYPEAKFINIIRDGRAVYRSTKETDWGYKDIITGSNNWRTIVENIVTLSNNYPDRAIICKYENLVDKPEVELNRICEFIDAEFVPEMLTAKGIIKNSFAKFHKGVGKKVYTDSVSLWEREMNTIEIGYFNAVNSDLLTLFGYETKRFPKIRINNFWKKYLKVLGYIKSKYYSRKAINRRNSVYRQYPDIKTNAEKMRKKYRL